MTRNDLDPPTETTLILRLTELTAAIERLASFPSAAELELKLFTPEEAAPLIGKDPYWIRDACRDGRIPHTRVGKSPRLSAAHIRWIQQQGEVLPNKYSKPVAA